MLSWVTVDRVGLRSIESLEKATWRKGWGGWWGLTRRGQGPGQQASDGCATPHPCICTMFVSPGRTVPPGDHTTTQETVLPRSWPHAPPLHQGRPRDAGGLLLSWNPHDLGGELPRAEHASASCAQKAPWVTCPSFLPCHFTRERTEYLARAKHCSDVLFNAMLEPQLPPFVSKGCQSWESPPMRTWRHRGEKTLTSVRAELVQEPA